MPSFYKFIVCFSSGGNRSNPATAVILQAPLSFGGLLLGMMIVAYHGDRGLVFSRIGQTTPVRDSVIRF